MKVYLAFRSDMDWGNIFLGAYTTKEAAEARLKAASVDTLSTPDDFYVEEYVIDTDFPTVFDH